MDLVSLRLGYLYQGRYDFDLEAGVFWISLSAASFAFFGGSLSNLASVITSFPALSLCSLP